MTVLEEACKVLRMAGDGFVLTLFNPAVNGSGEERLTAASAQGQRERAEKAQADTCLSVFAASFRALPLSSALLKGEETQIKLVSLFSPAKRLSSFWLWALTSKGGRARPAETICLGHRVDTSDSPAKLEKAKAVMNVTALMTRKGLFF